MAQVLTINDIRSKAPAAFAEHAHPKMSTQYGFIDTMAAVRVMNDEGYQVVKAVQDKARQRDPMFVRHALTFRHESSLAGPTEVGEYVPQILLINSHNGRTQMSMRAGLYRYICSNGMVVGNDTMRDAIRHTRNLTDQIIDRVRKAAALNVPLAKQIEHWKTVELTDGQMADFAARAARLRFGERANSYQAPAILEAVRTDDEGRDLWRVFNRVQENTTNRNLQGHSSIGRIVSSRPLSGIGENTAFNEMLWKIAEEYA